MKVTDINEKSIIVRDLSDLCFAIEQLELKKKAQEQEMKNSIDGIKESFKPANLVKSAYNKLTEDQTPLQMGLKLAGVLATTLIAKRALSPKKETKRYKENDEEQFVEVTTKKTPLLTHLALTAAANYVISKIPVVTAYTAATINQIVKKEE